MTVHATGWSTNSGSFSNLVKRSEFKIKDEFEDINDVLETWEDLPDYFLLADLQALLPGLGIQDLYISSFVDGKSMI